MGNTYNQVYIWCCKYGENRYCERCANKCASKHTGLLNSCLGEWHLLPYLVVLLISARIPPISTRVSAHCQAIDRAMWYRRGAVTDNTHLTSHTFWFDSAYIVTHYNDVIMSAMASQIFNVLIVGLTVCSGADQRKHQSSAWLVFVKGVGFPSQKTSNAENISYHDVIMDNFGFNVCMERVLVTCQLPGSPLGVFFLGRI